MYICMYANTLYALWDFHLLTHLHDLNLLKKSVHIVSNQICPYNSYNFLTTGYRTYCGLSRTICVFGMHVAWI